MDVNDAGRVVRFLMTAFPAYPMPDASSELYVEAVAGGVVDPAVGYAVVQDWVTSRVVFPTVAELLVECTAEATRRDRRARAIRAGQRAPHDPAEIACMACSDCGYEYHPYPDRPGYEYVLPCRVCDPVRHEDWRDGHVLMDHRVDGCDWPMCVQRAKKREGKRGGRRLAEPINEPVRADVGPGF